MVTKMNSKNSLIIGRGIFTIIVIMCFGLIIVSEKGGEILKPKIEAKMTTYINSNYETLINNVSLEEINYQNGIFKTKVVSNNNNNLFFYITYQNKEITDTYEKDFLEGKSLITYLEGELTNKIKQKTKNNCELFFITTLDKYSEKVQKRIIEEDNLLSLKVYYLKSEISVSEWKAEEITQTITNIINNNISNNITPKYYKFILIDKKDITKSIEISNITDSFLNNSNNIKIINDILEDNETEELKESKIKYSIIN